MEDLKRSSLIILLILFLSGIDARCQPATEAAFAKSYEAEQAGNYSKAIAELKTVYKPDHYFGNIRLGWLCYLDKQYAVSIQFYNLAISLRPYAIEAKFGCVKPLSALGNWDKVKEQYFQILKIDPQNTVANYWLGVIYYNRKDYANANKLFEKVVNLYPLDYDSNIMLAWTKLHLGELSDARVLFNHALIIRPNDSSANAGLKQLK
jgi:tetratricopeptide (TPR) repeat protein